MGVYTAIESVNVRSQNITPPQSPILSKFEAGALRVFPIYCSASGFEFWSSRRKGGPD